MASAVDLLHYGLDDGLDDESQPRKEVSTMPQDEPFWNGTTLPFCRDRWGGTVQGIRVTYHKLVRDQVPAIIAADGHQPVTRVLDHAGYEAALRAKLLEEAHEAQAAPDGQLMPELADVLEVLQALAAAHDMGWADIVSEASRKRAERGGFDQRIFLEYVDHAQ